MDVEANNTDDEFENEELNDVPGSSDEDGGGAEYDSPSKRIPDSPHKMAFSKF